MEPDVAPTVIGRYALHDVIASGGMAAVCFGRLAGPAGFTRTVAIKRMHKHLAKEPEFVGMFLDEARLAARIHHPNVVSTLDVVTVSNELLIVMEYVHGESLMALLRAVAERKERVPVPIAGAIVADLLAGLHAAHEAKGEREQPLQIIHRDVSPPNVLVGADGITRVLDFGVAKAVGRIQETLEGQVKGKIAYMAPEQVRGELLTRAVDIYAASVVLWEALTGAKLFESDRDATVVEKILFGTIDAPSARAPNIPEALNAVVLRGLSRDAGERPATAREMERALRDSTRLATTSEVSDWVEAVAGETLRERARKLESLAGDSGSAISLDEIPMLAKRRRTRAPVVLSVLGAALVSAIVLAARFRGTPPVLHATSPPSFATSWANAAPEPTDATPAASAAPPAPSAASSGSARPASNARGRPRQGCTPPYTIDSDGTRRYKLQCL